MVFEVERTFYGLPHIHTWDINGDFRKRLREIAGKPHEEAGELMVEAKSYIDAVVVNDSDDWLVAQCRGAMVEEIADVVQALANLCECMGVTDDELATAMKSCDRKNEARGRF